MDWSYQILGSVELDLRSELFDAKQIEHLALDDGTYYRPPFFGAASPPITPSAAATATMGYRLGVVEVERHEDAQWAMIVINPEKGEPATGWVLDIFGDGERLSQKVVELEDPQSREQCVVDAKTALSVHYSLSDADPPPSARAEHRWWLAPLEDSNDPHTDGSIQDGEEWTGGIMSQRFPTKPVY